MNVTTLIKGLDLTPDAGIWERPEHGIKSVTLTLIPPIIHLIQLVQKQNQADLPRCRHGFK